jgi:hypothetical protein
LKTTRLRLKNQHQSRRDVTTSANRNLANRNLANRDQGNQNLASRSSASVRIATRQRANRVSRVAAAVGGAAAGERMTKAIVENRADNAANNEAGEAIEKMCNPNRTSIVEPHRTSAATRVSQGANPGSLAIPN